MTEIIMNLINDGQIRLSADTKHNHEACMADGCIHHLFEAKARESPDAIALISGDERLTYQELNRRANRLARHLQSLGVLPESLVGLCLERSVEMVVGIMGILKAGGAYVPVDPAYPSDRIEFMLADSGVSLLLSREHLRDRLQKYTGKIVSLDGDSERIARSSDQDPVSSVKSGNLCYVIYTSGSTGKPKGVMITHENLVNYSYSLKSPLGLIASDCYLHTASISFSSSVRQMMVPLSIGASIVIATLEKIRDPICLFELIKQENVTVVDFVPSYWRSCIFALDNTPQTNVDRLLDNKLRLALSASEPLPVSIPRELTSKLRSHVRLVNMYGQTETSGIISIFEIEAARLNDAGIVPIGSAIACANTYIVDDDLKLVANGESGELCIGGPTVGRGYLDRHELTAERFVNDPFGENRDGRLYRTGDFARLTDSGEIEYVGRADNQVKIRGFRVELGEIESVVEQFHGVVKAVATAHETTSGDKRLSVYFVTRGGSKIDVSELRSFLKATVPDYMVPSIIVQLERIPVTPNGKTDRRALPEAPRIALDRDEHEAPRTETEKAMGEIWCSVLDLPEIGVTDNFFDFGDSLSAVVLFVEIENRFRVSLPLSALINSPTVEKLADLIERDSFNNQWKHLVPIQVAGARRPLFCMHAAGGNVLFYRDLANELGPDQPVYGLQARGISDKAETAHDRIEDMAKDYLEEIRSVQPRGPYRLCGSSFGGLIAFEVAQQLRRLAEEVEILGLFDTYGPGYFPKAESKGRGRSLNTILPRMRTLLKQLGEFEDARTQRDFVVGKLKKLLSIAERKYIWKRNQFDIEFRKAIGKDLPVDIQRNHKAIQKAQKTYRPDPYDGQIILFRASDQPRNGKFDPFLGWSKYTKMEIKTVEVIGSHGAMTVYPFARHLAKELGPMLADNATIRHSGGSIVAV